MTVYVFAILGNFQQVGHIIKAICKPKRIFFFPNGIILRDFDLLFLVGWSFKEFFVFHTEKLTGAGAARRGLLRNGLPCLDESPRAPFTVPSGCWFSFGSLPVEEDCCSRTAPLD